MRTIHTNVYKYDELSKEAQAVARDWYREMSAGDNYFAEHVTEEFKEVAKACGFSLGGSRCGDDGIQWSGFASQGDGASFTGSWCASRVNVAALLADRPAEWVDKDGVKNVCEGNARLAVILNGFARLAEMDAQAYGGAEASHCGHWMQCTYSTECEDDLIGGPDIEEREEMFKELCNDLAHDFYRNLEQEYEYQNSDDVVAENIEINEYEFTESGKRVGRDGGI